MGRAARPRRRGLPRAARLPARALGVLPREAGRAGIATAARRAGSPTSRALPLTEKHELRATVTPEQPDRRAPLRRRRTRSSASTRRAARPARRATSRSPPATSTTGSPARRAATPPRASAGPAHRLDLQRRAVRRGRRARRVRPHRPLPRPGRHRQHRAAGAGDRAAAARGGRAHAVLRGLPARVGGRARLRPRAARASSACSWPASPAAASRRSAPRLEDGWGARVTEAMGIGDIGVSLWGECEAAGRHAPRRARLRPRRADRPGHRRGARAGRRRHRRARAHAPAPPRRAAAALPHARPRRGPDDARARAAAPARASAASAAPTTC